MNDSQNKKISRFGVDRLLILIGILLIVIVWILGSIREEADLNKYIQMVSLEGAQIEYIDNNTYKAVSPVDSIYSYATIKSGYGYGGPMQTAIAVDSNGIITNIELVSSKDTPSYIEKVIQSPLKSELVGKSYDDAFKFDVDIDAVSGATFSSLGFVQSVKNGSRHIAEEYLDLPLPEKESVSLQIGFLELTLIFLFAVGYFAQRKTFKYKNQARWATMIIGLFVLGFYFDQPLTLSNFMQLLLGYFPDFQSHLYWYLLLGGIFLVFTVDNKNPYCNWFCPFGAAQECVGAIGGAKKRSLGKYKEYIKWSQRLLALTAILLALYYRNPGIASFEVFGVLFGFIGSNFLFAVTGIILLLSLFVKRPWCNYLCPLKPVVDGYSTSRKWIIDLWKKNQRKN